MPHLADDGQTLVLYGDIAADPARHLHQMRQAGEGTVLLTVNSTTTGYGRIVRNERGDVQASSRKRRYRRAARDQRGEYRL